MRSECRPRNNSPSVPSSSSITAPPPTSINPHNIVSVPSPIHSVDCHHPVPAVAPLQNPCGTNGVTPGYPPLAALGRASKDSHHTTLKKSRGTLNNAQPKTTPTYPAAPLVVPLAGSQLNHNHHQQKVTTEWADSRANSKVVNSHNPQHHHHYQPNHRGGSENNSSGAKYHHNHKQHHRSSSDNNIHQHSSTSIPTSQRNSIQVTTSSSASSRSASGGEKGASIEAKRNSSSSSSRDRNHHHHNNNQRHLICDSSSSSSYHQQLHHHNNQPDNITSLHLDNNSSASLLRQMGGCVTKGGAAANLIDPSSLPGPGSPERRAPRATIDPSASTDMSLNTNGLSNSPSTRPTDGTASNGSSHVDNDSTNGTLKNRERRRLSLSQSDPARPDVGGDEFRGQFLINQGHGGTGSPLSPGLLTQSQLEQLSHTAAAAAAAAVAGDPHSDDDDSRSDDESLPSSDEEAARRQKEEEHVAAGTSSKNGSSLPVPPAQRECRRLSVSGMPSSMKQDNFENKRQEVKSDTGFFDANTLLGLGIGYACKKGLKPESPNQDDFFIVRIDDWGLYGVFDGHGPYGHDVSNFVQRELPKLIYNDSNFLINPKEALRQSFITVHQMLEVAAATHNLFDCSLSGSTATVVLHRKTSNKLYMAHVGDSRCILGRLSKNGRKIEAVDLTIDHKPNTEAEKKRIVASGGQVRRLEGDIPYRVFLKGRLYPGLAMSRAIGDTVGTQAGVICEPDVSEYTINPDRDLFIVLCSDGVWEFLGSSDVAEVVHANGMRGVQTSADIIARESWNRWIQEEGNVVDDITSEVIYLNPEHPLNQQAPGRR